MLSDKVSTVREVQEHNPMGNKVRQLQLMLAAWMSQVQRKPAILMSKLQTKLQKRFTWIALFQLKIGNIKNVFFCC
jgi:hypothetical protein